jgi:hypothetical protein
MDNHILRQFFQQMEIFLSKVILIIGQLSQTWVSMIYFEALHPYCNVPLLLHLPHLDTIASLPFRLTLFQTLCLTYKLRLLWGLSQFQEQ